MVVEKELQEIREAVNPYMNEDVYNMEKSALFWKMAPDGTLGTEQSAGDKNDKARITINLTCNITGSHKLELWFMRSPDVLAGHLSTSRTPEWCGETTKRYE